jgi:hypothetical protein
MPAEFYCAMFPSCGLPPYSRRRRALRLPVQMLLNEVQNPQGFVLGPHGRSAALVCRAS